MNEHNQDDQDIPVEERKNKAYNMGGEEFEDADELLSSSEDIAQSLSQYKSGARWANIVSPRLRSMAGYADNGKGTHTEVRTVTTAAGEECQSTDIMEELVTAFDRGAHEAVTND